MSGFIIGLGSLQPEGCAKMFFHVDEDYDEYS